MVNKTKYCPLIKDECLEVECGIYDEYVKRCSFRNLGYLSNLSKIKYKDDE